MTTELRNAVADIHVVGAQHMVREPGNGTRYDIIGIRFSGRLYTGGRLGSVSDGWLITLGNGRSYLFQTEDFLAPWYVEEKLGVGAGDSEHVARAIAEMIGGTAE